eukprot:Trichotokara_eunicae@DN6231_c0_g1_i5.p1
MKAFMTAPDIDDVETWPRRLGALAFLNVLAEKLQDSCRGSRGTSCEICQGGGFMVEICDSVLSGDGTTTVLLGPLLEDGLPNGWLLQDCLFCITKLRSQVCKHLQLGGHVVPWKTSVRSKRNILV